MLEMFVLDRVCISEQSRSEHVAVTCCDKAGSLTNEVWRCRDQCRLLWRAPSFKAVAALAVGLYKPKLRELQLSRGLRVLPISLEEVNSVSGINRGCWHAIYGEVRTRCYNGSRDSRRKSSEMLEMIALVSVEFNRWANDTRVYVV